MGMAELVFASGLNPEGGNTMGVRFSLPTPDIVCVYALDFCFNRWYKGA